MASEESTDMQSCAFPARFSVLILMLIAASLLAGCPSSFIQTRPDDVDSLPDQYGLVTIQVVSNIDRISDALHTWTSIMAVDLDDPEKEYELMGSESGLLGSRVFVGALPPGRYAFYNLHSSRTTNAGNFWTNARVSRGLGDFKVQDGRLTSLGTIVYQPLSTTDSDDERGVYLVARYDETETFLRFAREAYPEAFDKLDDSAVLGWTHPRSLGEGDEIRERLQEFSISLNHQMLEDGEIITSGTLGQILWRKGVLDWQRVDTGFSQQIAVVRKMGEHYYAAGERGLVLRSRELSGPWERQTGPGTKEAIYWMDADTEGNVFALTKSGDRKRFYSVSGDLKEWTQEIEFSWSPGWAFTGSGGVFATVTEDDRVALFAEKTRRVYDRRFIDHLEQDVGNLYRFAEQPDGTLVTIPGHVWTGTGRAKFSEDAGRNWEDFPFVNDEEDRKVRPPSLPIILSNGSRLNVTHKTIVEGERQRVVAEQEPRVRDSRHEESIHEWGEMIEPNCTTLLPEISTQELVFRSCSDGRVFSSDDQGMTWTLDFDAGMSAGKAPDDLRGEGVVHAFSPTRAIAESSIGD